MLSLRGLSWLRGAGDKIFLVTFLCLATQFLCDNTGSNRYLPKLSPFWDKKEGKEVEGDTAVF